MSFVNFYNQFTLVNNFKTRPEIFVDIVKEPAHHSNKRKRWFGRFGIDYSLKLIWILFLCRMNSSQKVLQISSDIKRKIVKKLLYHYVRL
jgi:hypothetical protein